MEIEGERNGRDARRDRIGFRKKRRGVLESALPARALQVDAEPESESASEIHDDLRADLGSEVKGAVIARIGRRSHGEIAHAL